MPRKKTSQTVAACDVLDAAAIDAMCAEQAADLAIGAAPTDDDHDDDGGINGNVAEVPATDEEIDAAAHVQVNGAPPPAEEPDTSYEEVSNILALSMHGMGYKVTGAAVIRDGWPIPGIPFEGDGRRTGKGAATIARFFEFDRGKIPNISFEGATRDGEFFLSSMSHRLVHGGPPRITKQVPGERLGYLYVNMHYPRNARPQSWWVNARVTTTEGGAVLPLYEDRRENRSDGTITRHGCWALEPGWERLVHFVNGKIVSVRWGGPEAGFAVDTIRTEEQHKEALKEEQVAHKQAADAERAEKAVARRKELFEICRNGAEGERLRAYPELAGELILLAPPLGFDAEKDASLIAEWAEWAQVVVDNGDARHKPHEAYRCWKGKQVPEQVFLMLDGALPKDGESVGTAELMRVLGYRPTSVGHALTEAITHRDTRGLRHSSGKHRGRDREKEGRGKRDQWRDE